MDYKELAEICRYLSDAPSYTAFHDKVEREVICDSCRGGLCYEKVQDAHWCMYEALQLAATAITNLLARAEAVEADRDGRCGIPPVKLHQRIFRVFNGKILEEMVCSAVWEPFTPKLRWKVWVMGAGLPYYWDVVFGKTVFLTRDAAEAALKGP